MAVGHVLAAKHANRQHFLWCQLRLEVGVKIPSDRFGELVGVAFLHGVVHGDGLLSHRCLTSHKINNQQQQPTPPADVRDDETEHDALLPSGWEELS